VSESMGAKVWTPSEVSDVLKGLNVAGDFALDPANALGRKFAATSYPTLVVMGKDGKIAAITAGNKANLEDLVKGQLDPLLGKAPGDEIAVDLPEGRVVLVVEGVGYEDPTPS